jgi:spore coat protein CotH
MMTRFSTFASSCLLWLAVVLTPAVVHAQPDADFFDPETLQEVRLFINSRDLAEMLERYWEDRHYPADFMWRDIRVRNVAVRIRGLATRSREKPGLRIDFNRYVDGQEFLGLDSLVLDNVLKDPALIRERMSMAFIDRMGQPAPRESFGRLYINNVYRGVYTLVEPVDKDFLMRTLGESSGYLFEKKFVTAFLGEYLGDDLDTYKALFQPQTRQLEPDSILYSPIRDLFREANHDVDGMWREWVSEYIDLPQLVSHVAIETFLAEVDGFLGYAGMANFYLYRPAGQSFHRVFPWDRDSTFQEIDSPIFARFGNNVLFDRALAFADLRNLYLDVLERCALSASDGGWLEAQIIRADALIRQSVHEDASKPFSNEDYDQGIAYLVEFAKRRSHHVLKEVARAREVTSR